MIPHGALDALSHEGLRANWRDDGACLPADPGLFFPVATAGTLKGAAAGGEEKRT
jgi:hypothetical protein